MDDDENAPDVGIWTGLRPYAYVVLRILSLFIGTIFGSGSTSLIDRILRDWLGPPPSPLTVRAQEVSDALVKVGELIEELQAEVNARMALIESLVRTAEDAEKRADDATRRANLSEEESKAVDSFLDRAIKAQLKESEGRSRRREWGLATLGGLLIGVAAIMVAHFLFGW